MRHRHIKRKPLFLDNSSMPTFPAVRTRDGRCLMFVCPSCGNENVHGGGRKAGDGDGARSSHCGCFGGYNIKEIIDTRNTLHIIHPKETP
jgi:hypothetical protein